MESSFQTSPESETFAHNLCRTILGLCTQNLRLSYLRATLPEVEPELAAAGLALICQRADRGDTQSREVLVSVVPILQEIGESPWAVMLRSICAAQSCQRLLDLIPSQEPFDEGLSDNDDERAVPDYGRGRTLTLGERKSLARRPSRDLMDRLLLDPHPQVIRNLLSNPITTEDDVVRLAAKRPLPPEILGEIAKHPRWQLQRRVKLALVLNPGCPPAVGVALVGILLKADLRLVVLGTEVHELIRQAARRRLGEGLGQ